MKPAQKVKARMTELQKTFQQLHESLESYLPQLESKLNTAFEVVKEFHSSFEMQLNTICEAERLSNLRAEKLEAAVQEVQFWNHLKEEIIERQKRENLEISRVADSVVQTNNTVLETDKAVMFEQAKVRQAEQEQRKKAGRLKNVTNRMAPQGDTSFDCEGKNINFNLQRNKESIHIELKFIPDKHKYIIAGECHPKVAALVSHFNFHKDLQRLRKELRDLLNVL